MWDWSQVARAVKFGAFTCQTAGLFACPDSHLGTLAIDKSRVGALLLALPLPLFLLQLPVWSAAGSIGWLAVETGL